MKHVIRKNSATVYLLLGLIPYTDANLRLAYKPNSFFRELSRKHNINSKTLNGAYRRALSRGLLTFTDEGTPLVAPEALAALRPYTSRQLRGAKIIVIFDIPESEKHTRQKFRTSLKSLEFKQVQKSVWETSLDCRDYIQAIIAELDIDAYVKVYETREL